MDKADNAVIADDVVPTEDVTISYSGMAIDTMRAMREKVWDLRIAYGPDSDEYRKAADSLLTNLVMMASSFFGGYARVTKDGELSLYVAHWKSKEQSEMIGPENRPAFVYGIIWHERRKDDAPEGYVPSGEWSFHS